MAYAKKPGPQREIEVERRDSRPGLYANSVVIKVSPWDFAFHLGTVSEATEKKVKIQEDLCVYMSPQHTKVFLTLLTNQVKLYEEKFGVIPEPKITTVTRHKKSRPKR